MTLTNGHIDRHERDHYVRSPAPWVAGCSDIGLKHATNQDALSLAAKSEPERIAILVVADGVSTASGAEAASRAAAEAASAHLTACLHSGTPLNTALVEAFSLAHDAVEDAAQGGEPSACTLVAAVVQQEQIVVANIGDSRAYWVGDDQSCRLLTTDDSMAQARIMLGMSRDEAEQSSQAHSITKWLGRDATDVTPSITTVQPTTNGWLLVCTDGLWNYASSPPEMYDVFDAVHHKTQKTPAMAEELVAWALTQGGRDNVTVAIARHQAH